MSMGGNSGVEVIESKGCSKLFVGLSSSMAASSFRGLQLQHFESMSAAATSASVIGSDPAVVRTTKGPFSGLVICVTGLSKARRQVMDATERLGGQYSPDLHPQCTHLVVQSFGGRKFEHALKHGSKNGLLIVTLGWFVDSVRRNVRLSESLYSVKSVSENGVHLDDLNRFIGTNSAENSCLPVGVGPFKQFDMDSKPLKQPARSSDRSKKNSMFSDCFMYVDPNISEELQKKIYEAATREGANFANQWSVGCNVSHVVTEGASVQRYLGHTSHLVTPPWVLKTVKEQQVQKFVHLSSDLARHVGTMLENFHDTISQQDTRRLNSAKPVQNFVKKSTLEERQRIVSIAKNAVRNRRNRRMQTCQTPIRPITPSSLLDSICWTISDPTSMASIYMDSFSSEDASEHQTSVFFDAKADVKDSESSFTNLTRPLTESEKTELIFKGHFLTILFPVDRFSEMGPSSRTYFGENGFTCLQVLDHIYDFYQENMSAPEVEAAIHTDSRHADRLRSVYSSKETMEWGFVSFKRIDFLGSRKSFEMLKRVSGENNSNVYELLIRA